MNERISWLQMSLNPPFEVNPEILDDLLRSDGDWQAVYCLTEEPLKIYTEHDLKSPAELGKQTLQSEISHWRYTLRECVRELKRMQQLIDFLSSHKDVESLSEYAAKFAGIDPEHGYAYDEWLEVNVPTDVRELERDWKTSTLQVCGWCKFCSGGVMRGNCNLTCGCRLMASRLCKQAGRMAFDTPCVFRKLVENDSEAIPQRLKELHDEKHRLLDEKNAYLRKIAILSRLRDEAEDKPILPCCGLHVSFEDGERVIVLSNEPKKQNPMTGEMPLYRGTVIPSKYQIPNTANRPKVVYSDFHSYTAYICAGVQMSNYSAVQLDADSGIDEPWYVAGSGFGMTMENFKFLCENPGHAKLWLAGLNEHSPYWVKQTWAKAFERGVKN